MFKTSDSTTKNSKIEFDSKVSKKQTSYYVSKELLHSSFAVNGFDYDLPIANDHCELQTREFINSTGNVQLNTLIDKNEYINDI